MGNTNLTEKQSLRAKRVVGVVAARKALCLWREAYGRGSVSLCLSFPQVSRLPGKRELETSCSSQVQGIAQAAPDEHLGSAV